MIHFFRDVMEGPIYIVVLIVSILAIMGIIGFIMERYKLRNEETSKIQVVDAPKPEKAGTLIISTNEKKKEEKTDLEKTELLDVITKEQLQKEKELEKTEILSIVSDTKPVSKESEKPALEITTPKMSEAALEKTEVLEIVSLPSKKTEEELGKTEILDLNFSLPKENISTPIPAVEVTSSPTKTEILAINSSNNVVSGDMNVKPVAGEEAKKPTTVIDFGSTNDVKINQS